MDEDMFMVKWLAILVEYKVPEEVTKQLFKDLQDVVQEALDEHAYDNYVTPD